MDEKPSILIVSSSNTKASSIIKLIARTNNLKTCDKGAVIHPWLIDTKYYTTEVNLIAIDKTYQRSQQFNEKVEALIIHVDANKESGLDDLEIWRTIEQDCEPEIKLLISNYCNKDTKITIEMALEWCLKYGYEFIELYPTVTKEESNDELIKEKVGVERVIEALETHTWPNLVMKSKKQCKSILKSENNPQSIDNADEECFRWIDKSENILTNDCLDDFNELFSQLNVMRESLKDMSPNQKRLCAEQMATAFWKAIGGDEEEIADI